MIRPMGTGNNRLDPKGAKTAVSFGLGPGGKGLDGLSQLSST